MNELEKIFNIKNKTVLITGASGFLGRYACEAFLKVGARVILLSRSIKVVEQTEEYRERFGEDKVFGAQVDFYDRARLRDIITSFAYDFTIDAIINNAYDMGERTGFNTQEGFLENLTYVHWKSAFECGIYGAVLITQIIGKQLIKEKRRGSIINIGSMYSIVAPDSRLYEDSEFLNPATYSVNKAGILAFTRYVASFWGKYGIRCNAILPGPFPNVESKSSNSVNSRDPFLKKLENKTVLNRTGHPKELDGALIYLACDASSFVTGQTIIVDGGWTTI